MKILVFDTETTGLPKKNASILDSTDWPYIVQFSYILYDTSNHTVFTYLNDIVKIPDYIEISKESINIHKITKEKTLEDGVNIKDILTNFNLVVKNSDLIIAHNIEFDKKMVIAECRRNDIECLLSLNDTGRILPEYCTMKNSVNLCKILAHNRYNNSYYKYPKLIELYQHLFKSTPSGLHNSMVDILLCLRCYGLMVLNIDLYNESKNIKELFLCYNIIYDS
jgi:DNA polymerase III epsilon subunit-like protein